MVQYSTLLIRGAAATVGHRMFTLTLRAVNIEERFVLNFLIFLTFSRGKSGGKLFDNNGSF